MNPSRLPGAAIPVIDHDKLVYSRGCRLTDLETRPPIATDTLFYPALMSKQFTAVAIMLLAEPGAQSLS
jgi:CubicO group peptidase (beta-lactamase class C family)